MKSYLKTIDFFLTHEQFELLYDDDLDLLITHPKPEHLDRYYEADNYISHSDAGGNLLEKVYQKVKKINLGQKTTLIETYAASNRKILDLGAGTGEFLLHAKGKGWEVCGVEPNESARKLAMGKGIDLKINLESFRQEKFQVITLWHVLEHLPNLKQSIKALSQMLEDTGTLIVAVPNFKSYDAKHYGEFWAAYDVPRHLWHFSKTAIKKLFGEQNIEVKKVKPMWFDSFYVSLLSEEYKTAKKNWIPALWVGLWSNLNGIFTKEYSSHIYILQKANRKP